jgi:hypothetical protein
MRIERLTLDKWADALPDSGFEVFHTAPALSVLDDHAAGDLSLLGGFNGDQPVALVPLFVRRGPLGTAMLSSPPPGFNIPHLGPIAMPQSPKRRKREKQNGEFAERVIEALDADDSRTLFRAVCAPTYDDPRPFRWAGFDVDAAFTYRLAVDGSPDELLSSFSKSLRREIRDGTESDVVVSRAGREAAEAVYWHTAARYAEQGEELGSSWEYVRDLLDALGTEGRYRVYTAETADGRFLGGIIVLYSNDCAYYWLGGVRTTHEGVSVNSLLHWHIIRDVAGADSTNRNGNRDEGGDGNGDSLLASVSQYDLVGANTERLCRYKAKFGADLRHYYAVESAGPRMTLAKTAYERVNSVL